MRQPSSASSASSGPPRPAARAGRAGIFLLQGLLLLALCLCALRAASAEDDGVRQVWVAQFVLSDAAVVPGDDAPWQTVRLPHRAVNPGSPGLTAYWYKAGFHVDDPGKPMWMYFPRLRTGGAIFLNGQQIEEIRGSSAQYQVRWFRPHLFFVPPMALKKGENQVAVRLSTREPLTGFGEFQIGPQRPLRDAYSWLNFWEATSTTIAYAICLFSGTLILLFWLRRRHEIQYGIFGVCVLLWGLRTFVFQMLEVPMAYWTWWRFCYYFSTAGFIVCITLFLIDFSGPRKPFIERLLVLSWVGGCLLFLAVGPSMRQFMDLYWVGSFLPFTVYSVLRLCRYAIRERTVTGTAMAVTMVFAVGLALHDYSVQHGFFGASEFYLLHLGIPVLLLVLACVLLERFVESLRAAESINEKLAVLVAMRERALSSSYERVRLLERQQAVTEERQRIMQEMHDGVGSQLLATLVMAQRGAATPAAMAVLLQECLDEMRLAIDSLLPEDPDLLSALGNFRFRMESRFKALGIELDWRNHKLPDSLEMSPHAVLQILRILQEALTNVIKHAQASRVELDLRFECDCVCIRIADNGIGFERGTGRSGRGLDGMAGRAGKLGATFGIERLPAGTAIRLDVPHKMNMEMAA